MQHNASGPLTSFLSLLFNYGVSTKPCGSLWTPVPKDDGRHHAAELGCGRKGCGYPLVPPGQGPIAWDDPALPEPCSHHGCAGRGACLSSGGCFAVPPDGSSDNVSCVAFLAPGRRNWPGAEFSDALLDHFQHDLNLLSPGIGKAPAQKCGHRKTCPVTDRSLSVSNNYRCSISFVFSHEALIPQERARSQKADARRMGIASPQ